MTQGLATSVVMSLFLLLTSVIFLFLTSSWTDQSFNTAEAMARQRARVETVIAINSTNESGVACTSYTAQVSNSGEVFIEDFSDMDLLAEYINASNTKVATRLVHTTDWSVASIAPDTRDPNAWNPGEVATINFTLPWAMKGGEKGTVLVVTPLGVLDSNYFSCTCTAGDSGISDPSAEAADTGGDNDGYELNPTDAFSDGIAYASNLNGNDDRHRFYNYGFSIHSACAISGIEVRLDWWLDSLGGKNSMDVELSWDAGASWTAAKTDNQETTSEHTVILGGAADTWGRSWSVSEFTDANFRVRATMNGVGGRDYFLDWMPVKVYYAP